MFLENFRFGHFHFRITNENETIVHWIWAFFILRMVTFWWISNSSYLKNSILLISKFQFRTSCLQHTHHALLSYQFRFPISIFPSCYTIIIISLSISLIPLLPFTSSFSTSDHHLMSTPNGILEPHSFPSPSSFLFPLLSLSLSSFSHFHFIVTLQKSFNL